MVVSPVSSSESTPFQTCHVTSFSSRSHLDRLDFCSIIECLADFTKFWFEIRLDFLTRLLFTTQVYCIFHISYFYL